MLVKWTRHLSKLFSSLIISIIFSEVRGQGYHRAFLRNLFWIFIVATFPLRFGRQLFRFLPKSTNTWSLNWWAEVKNLSVTLQSYLRFKSWCSTFWIQRWVMRLYQLPLSNNTYLILLSKPKSTAERNSLFKSNAEPKLKQKHFANANGARFNYKNKSTRQLGKLAIKNLLVSRL